MSRPLPEARVHDPLDAEIAAAERAVAERDRRLRADAGALAQRLREQIGRSARLASALAGGSFALGWLFALLGTRRGRRHGAAPLHESPWPTLIPLLWPLLPLALRDRVSPGFASFLTGIGLPLLAQRLARRAAAKRRESPE